MKMPPPGDVRAHLTAAADHLSMQVGRGNVLQARNALLGEVGRLRAHLRANIASEESIGLCGDDPVSHDARSAFTERIDGLVQHCWDYTVELEAAAHRLDETARSYGWTDEEIEASFSTNPSPPLR